MNMEQFQQYIENTRDCNAALLDAAVCKGLLRAEDERFDFRKLMKLAALCAVIASICITASITLIEPNSSGFLFHNNMITQSSAGVLHDFFTDLASVVSIISR